MATHGDYAVVGNPHREHAGFHSGAAYVSRRDGDVWTEVAKLAASDAHARQEFCYSVAIHGDHVVVGAANPSASWAGEAYVFHRDQNGWSETAKLVASDGVTGDRFDNAVAISGDCLG